MTTLARSFGLTLALLLGSGMAYADGYDGTIELFKRAGESAVFFGDCYGYAVFPTIGAGGLMFSADISGEKFAYTERPRQ